MPKKPSIPNADDTVLWQRVTHQITPLKSRIAADADAALFTQVTGSQMGKFQAGKSKKSRHKAVKITSLQSSTASKTSGKSSIKTSAKTSAKSVNLPIGTSQTRPKAPLPVDLRQGERAGIDGGTQRRLFRGEVPIDRRLDLHGMSAATAEARTQSFMRQAASDGCRCVLLITGKGAGILRAYIPDILKRAPLSQFILALAEARPGDGGSGAFYVLLRRQRGKS